MSAQVARGLAVRSFRPEILDRFDLIGVDLRATCLSDPITCDRNIYNERIAMYASDEVAYAKLVKHNQDFRQSCIHMTGRPLIDYMDTVSIVKEHEKVRQALGGGKMAFVGQSYSTQLGSQYAELLPDNIRAMLLDSSLSLSQSETSAFVEDALSADKTMQSFLEWCSQQNTTTCPAAHANKTMDEVWMDLMDTAERSPVPAPACQGGTAPCASPDFTADEMRTAALNLLYQPSTHFPLLAQAI